MSEKQPKITVDSEAEAAYIYVSDKPVARTIECFEGVLIDVDADGKLVGVEVLYGS